MKEGGAEITVYTDGSAIGNGKSDSKCGWACKLIYKGHERMKSGWKTGKTNNQMEIIAVIEALKSITDKTLPVTVYSDSRYVVNTLNGRMRGGRNGDLWDLAKDESRKFREIRFLWVKGHQKNQHNIDVDRAAVEAARNGGKKVKC